MSDNTKIEWTDATWNPITGCSVVSAGCKHCYAMKLAGTRLRNHPSRHGLTIDTSAGPVWNGKVRLNAEWLDQPLRWKRPRRIFVCAHGDLFHESVPDEWIDRVLGIAILAPQHTFQILTKRATRMRDYFRAIADDKDRAWKFRQVSGNVLTSGMLQEPNPAHGVALRARRGEVMFGNVWLGISAEDNESFDERINPLLETPAAVRFLSLEPLLGPINDDVACVDWVICGGESGQNARPMQADWARSIRDQCAAVGVPFFFKQWGEWLHESQPESAQFVPDEERGGVHLWDDTFASLRVGKRAAGRLLDGREHSAFPEAA